MSRMIFTVTIDTDTSLESSLCNLITPELLRKAIDAEIGKVAPSDHNRRTYTVKVSGGGPLTEVEESRVWLREMFARSTDPIKPCSTKRPATRG